ncbi:MAG: cell division protein [Lachnospiraceae bacterium]|nr:cell division protein [Lachnospiraceae bacterium]
MLTLYTAIGHLKFQKNTDQTTTPLVINQNQEYGLTHEELLLWSCLAFQILQIHELEDAYMQRKNACGTEDTASFAHTLNRLMLRGLIAKGDGMTGADALYRLLGELYITPVENHFSARLFSCIHLYLKGDINRKDFGSYLKKAAFTPIEETILQLANAVPLSTAELVTCVKNNITVQSDQDVLEALYQDSDVTCKTLAEDVAQNHVHYPVLQAVGNLYLNKQILFQKF